jgi:uncharacterized membrane protein
MCNFVMFRQSAAQTNLNRRMKMKKSSIALASMMAAVSAATVVPAAYAVSAKPEVVKESHCEGCHGCEGHE